MSEGNNFDLIRLGIASPQDVKSWSKGEVKKPETINYRTFKPERDGLFCERIFGPTRDWECHCGKYRKIKFKGIICDRCGVEVTRSKVRRRRMGHIELAAPVAHIWYVKGVPSPMSLLLDLSPRLLEKVLYFGSCIVTRVDRGSINRGLSKIKAAAQAEIGEIEGMKQVNLSVVQRELAALRESQEATPEAVELATHAAQAAIQAEERTAKERVEEILGSVELLSKLEKRQLLSEAEHRNLVRLTEGVARKMGKGFEKLFQAGMGADAVQQLLEDIDVDKLTRDLRKTVAETAGAKRARAIKRLEVVESFRKSKNRPEWMIMKVIPVMPPELRPMVQLDGGRFATSDLNDLYRRIINRNNRLKKIMEIQAPESIINHEKRLLQEAVDALIDNSRRSRPVTGSNGRPLKSLSDMLKGKEGRFRKNLLGKRVDYSGRSVIVVGPHLKMNQCGLPKEMALELFKPFVMKRLVELQYTTNIKTAKRMVDRQKPEVWDALEEVIRDHPVLLNRAPTLHRLGIQAFMPVLVDGKAIQLHPLVCTPYNADFDGDQMAVHVPLSLAAQTEARVLMLSTNNLFSPSDGSSIMSPAYDIVLGSYYLTQDQEGSRGTGNYYPNSEQAVLAYEMGDLDLHAMIKVRVNKELLDKTTVGRVIFNELLPEGMKFVNQPVDYRFLKEIITDCHRQYGNRRTVQLLDDVKSTGFLYATRSGMSIAVTDMDVPAKRDEIIRDTEKEVTKINHDHRMGRITSGEREQKVCECWIRAMEDVAEEILARIDRFNPLYMMANSGARGSKKQISQLVGMRGLMTEPSGRYIEDLPIKHNFHEGLTVLEYFISTHGARKGLADTALRTADAGYLTRRLVDVAQDAIVRAHDCGTVSGIEVTALIENEEEVESLAERIVGRTAVETIKHPTRKKEVLVEAHQEISEDTARRIGEAGITRVIVRSPLTCDLPQGICALCYGRDLSSGQLVEIGEAVGIIAAQSIGEPGTQLTMRTFHLGGVAGQYLTGVADVKKRKQQALRELHQDIREGVLALDARHEEEAEQKREVQAMLKVLEEPVRGLLRVVELFEARKPKGQAIVSEVDGEVVQIDVRGQRRVIIHSEQTVEAPEQLVGKRLGADAIAPRTGKKMAEARVEITEKVAQAIKNAGIKKVTLEYSYLVPHRGNLHAQKSAAVTAGDRLTDGPLAPMQVLAMKGVRGVQDYLVREIQAVYRGQGVRINDKHIEIIVRQMLRKRKVRENGDTDLLPGQVVDRFEFERENVRVRALKGKEATADWILLGITEAALATDSFLSSASFQKTTKILTDAAVRGKEDNLVGLKENVIIGRLIPAGTGLACHAETQIEVPGQAVEDLLMPRRLKDNVVGDLRDETDFEPDIVREMMGRHVSDVDEGGDGDEGEDEGEGGEFGSGHDEIGSMEDPIEPNGQEAA